MWFCFWNVRIGEENDLTYNFLLYIFYNEWVVSVQPREGDKQDLSNKATCWAQTYTSKFATSSAKKCQNINLSVMPPREFSASLNKQIKFKCAWEKKALPFYYFNIHVRTLDVF